MHDKTKQKIQEIVSSGKGNKEIYNELLKVYSKLYDDETKLTAEHEALGKKLEIMKEESEALFSFMGAINEGKSPKLPDCLMSKEERDKREKALEARKQAGANVSPETSRA